MNRRGAREQRESAHDCRGENEPLDVQVGIQTLNLGPDRQFVVSKGQNAPAVPEFLGKRCAACTERYFLGIEDALSLEILEMSLQRYETHDADCQVCVADAPLLSGNS